MTSDHDPADDHTPADDHIPADDTPADDHAPSLDGRWVDAMRRQGGTPASDGTWRAIVDRAEDLTPLPAAGRGPASRLVWAAAAAVVALVVGAAAVIATSDTGDDERQRVEAGPAGPAGGDGPAEEWERLPDPPLSPRSGVMSAWTGDELLVFGGTTWGCPPGASCVGPTDDQLFTDGAALDPETGEWRPIAPMPTSVFWGDVATVGDEVFVLWNDSATGSETAVDALRLASYSAADDTWTEVAVPDAVASGWYRPIAVGDRLLLATTSDEAGVRPLVVHDPETGAWTELPAAPLPEMYDHAAVWSEPHLYLFGKELVPDPGSEEPSLTIGARIDLDTGAWERLPDSEILGVPAVAADGLLVSAGLGGADGGQVNGWGRWYPDGGLFDIATQTWRDLPPAPEVGGMAAGATAGVLGSDVAEYWSSAGLLFDTTTEGWIEMPVLDARAGAAEGYADLSQVHAAGMDAVVVGGIEWTGGGEPDALGDAWIWRSGRAASAGPPTGEGAVGGPVPGDGEDQRYFVAATVLDDGDGPELCLGGMATSLPPQCGGPSIVGWDWDEVDGEESAAGTTWGDFEVVGTYDRDTSTFTLTEPAAPIDPSDDPELLDAPPDLDPDFASPCPEPEGGWPVADPAVWGIDQLNAFLAEARTVDGFAGLWMADAPAGEQAGGGVYVVAVAGGPEVEADAEDALRGLWGGAICVTSADLPYRELELIRDRATLLAEQVGETVLTSSISEAGNEVHLQVVAPSADLQTRIDESVGEGTVVLSSALRRLA